MTTPTREEGKAGQGERVKACPLCGEPAKVWNGETALYAYCETEGCQLQDKLVPMKIWQARPTEIVARTEASSLREELERAKARIVELENAALMVRDRMVPNIEKNASEGDKVVCATGAIRSMLAVVIPLWKYPAHALVPKPEALKNSDRKEGAGNENR